MEETTICFIKIESENMKMTSNISLFIFSMICNFLNVMALQFCEECLSSSVVLSLLPLLRNHDNLTLKLHQKK